MASLPLVTVTIPTYNSAHALDRCLNALSHQTYKNTELSIVDSYSDDDTVKIASRYKVKVYLYNGGLLGSRMTGIVKANGRYVLLLDSDQIVMSDTIARSVQMCENGIYDMLALEEDVYRCTNIIEWLFSMDRRLIHKVANLDPVSGVILPRFFSATLLRKAIGAIPKDIVSTVGGPDHAIVYYECYKLSHRVDILPNAVLHIEPSSLNQMWRKFYRWGYTSASAKMNKEYGQLLAKKERFRTGLFTEGLWLESIGSIMLLVLKGIPYKVGYIVARYLKSNS